MTGGQTIYITDYSDNTPDVTVSHDALGRQLTQSNGVATCTYSYNPDTLAIDTETIAYNLDGQPGAEFTRVLDRSQDSLSRPTGFTLGVPASAQCL